MKLMTVDLREKESAKMFADSICNTGFAIVQGHDIPDELIEGTYNEWKEFFGMPESYKSQFLFKRDYEIVQDGFVPLSISEQAKGFDCKDIKEFYHFSPAGRIPAQIVKTQVLYNSLLSIAAKLLTWLFENLQDTLANSLDQPLQDMLDDRYQTILRAVHYPPMTVAEEGAMRAAPHEDINLITLLVAATEPGLEVQSRDGAWHAVSPRRNAIVVNAGDMLQEATQGYYKSTKHRVINPAGEDASKARYSMPLFVHPRDEVRLSARYTAKEYLNERLAELGLL